MLGPLSKRGRLSVCLRWIRSSSGITSRVSAVPSASPAPGGAADRWQGQERLPQPIENGAITLVSPGILWELGEVYDVPYRELLERAGHRVPEDRSPKLEKAIAGVPLRAIAELDDEAQQDLIEYIAFLKQRKP